MRGIPLEDALSLGREFVLDTGEKWDPEEFQIAVIDALCRGVKRVWLEIPEGNAKTTLSAIVALIHLFYVKGAFVPVAASSRDQANTLLTQAINVVHETPGLWQPTKSAPGYFRTLEGHRRITCPSMRGRLQVFAADAGTGDGVIPTLPILEELHEHPDLGLMRRWYGKLWKKNGQMVIISTAGAPGSPYEIAKAKALAECEARGHVHREPGLTVAVMDGFEMRIHALGEDDDVEDLALVKCANPLSIVTEATLAEKRADPTWERSHWARFTCGVPTRGSDAAVSSRMWRDLLEEEIPAGQPIGTGLDLAWRHDTTAIGPLWMAAPDRRVMGPPKIIVPPRDGTDLDPELIREAFREVHDRNPIEVVAMDMSAGGPWLAEWLADPAGEIGATVVDVSQANVVQARSYALFMEAIRMGWLRRPPNCPELEAHVLNAVAKRISHDRYRFDRATSSRAATLQDQRVIDALIAVSGIHWHFTAGLDMEPEQPFDPAAYRIEQL